LLLLISVYLRAFGLALGILLVCFAGFGLLSVGGTSQNPPTAAIAVFPIMMILYFPAYVYGVIVALRLSLAFPAWMEEELTTGEAMRRSSQLTKGSKGRIFLLLLVIYAITYAFLFVFYLLGIVFFAIGALGMTAMHMHPTDPAFIVGICVAGVILLVLIFVWMALLYGSIVIMLSVVYHDQRRRKDAPLPAQLPVTGAELPPGAQPA
jgi:membrane-anchored glycerophosphoryl diester phosphodiesterase (GDPDase)